MDDLCKRKLNWSLHATLHFSYWRSSTSLSLSLSNKKQDNFFYFPQKIPLSKDRKDYEIDELRFTGLGLRRQQETQNTWLWLPLVFSVIWFSIRISFTYVEILKATDAAICALDMASFETLYFFSFFFVL